MTKLFAQHSQCFAKKKLRKMLFIAIFKEANISIVMLSCKISSPEIAETF